MVNYFLPKYATFFNYAVHNSRLYLKVPPERVIFMNAGFHILAREKFARGAFQFIERVLLLQERGFNIDVGYVTYPPLLSKLSRDIEDLKALGVRLPNAKTFRGYFNGKKYPEAFTADEKALIYSYALDPREERVLNSEARYFGKLCAAGLSSFRMDPAGNVYRCATSWKKYGNLFEGSFRPDTAPVACPFRHCACPYEGFKYANGGRASSGGVIREVANELLAIPGRGITPKKVLRYVRRKMKFAFPMRNH